MDLGIAICMNDISLLESNGNYLRQLNPVFF
jgi:hypothetical protein